MPAFEVVERGVEVDPLRPRPSPRSSGRTRDCRRNRARRRPRLRGGSGGRRGSEQRRVGAVLGPEPLADRAPAERAVEREVVRRQFLEAPAAAVADAVLAVAVDRPARLVGLVADPARRARPLCPGRAPTRPSRPAATGSRGGRPRGRSRPRSDACDGGSAWAARPGSPTRRRPAPGRSPRPASRPRAPS